MFKIVKISSLACPSCIIMNNVFNKIISTYNIESVVLDYDEDDITEYNVGNIIPVFIIYKDNKEITRFCGEHKFEQIDKVLRGLYEENNN